MIQAASARLLDLTVRTLRTGSQRLWRASNTLAYRSVALRFRPRPDDVFVVSYPRSGTTLLQMLCHQVATAGAGEFDHIDDVVPYFDLVEDFAALDDLPSPRFFKTHLPLRWLPRTSKKIYVARRIEDVAISMYHHDRLMGAATESFDAYVTRAIIGARRATPLWGPWDRHVQDAVDRRHRPEVLFMTYHDVVGDLAVAAREIAAFSGVAIRDFQVPIVVARCSREAMRREQAKFDPRPRPRRRNAAADAGFVREAGADPGLTTSDRERLRAQLIAAFGPSLRDPAGASLLPR